MTRTATRRSEIRRLIGSRSIATQEELRALLATSGHRVTQATLSRDLAKIGARRAARPDGGTAYELGDDRSRGPVGGLVRSIADNGSLVVIHTEPGAAQVIASALDRARLPELLGTIAGDDAIFLAPARGVSAGKLAKRVRGIVG
jgi:transcriptional regulator of arginine metabolism